MNLFKKMICLSSVLVMGLLHAQSEIGWGVNLALGQAFYQDVAKNDSQTALARLDIDYTFMTQELFSVGLGAGVQNGNQQRLLFPKADIDVLGGVPIDAVIKPFLDFMLNIKTKNIGDTPTYAWAKAGAAYRQLRTDRDSVNDMKKFSPEMMVGLGWQISEKASFTIGYQYIHGTKPVLSVNPENETGILNNIPAQQGVLAGITLTF